MTTAQRISSCYTHQSQEAHMPKVKGSQQSVLAQVSLRDKALTIYLIGLSAVRKELYPRYARPIAVTTMILE